MDVTGVRGGARVEAGETRGGLGDGEWRESTEGVGASRSERVGGRRFDVGRGDGRNGETGGSADEVGDDGGGRRRALNGVGGVLRAEN